MAAQFNLTIHSEIRHETSDSRSNTRSTDAKAGPM